MIGRLDDGACFSGWFRLLDFLAGVSSVVEERRRLVHPRLWFWRPEIDHGLENGRGLHLETLLELAFSHV